MINIKKSLALAVGCIYSFVAIAQLGTYDFKMQLSGIEDQWHVIELPVSVFDNISQNMNDLRIYGVTLNDTIEAPYILKVKSDNYIQKVINFKLLNRTLNKKGYYYTFKVEAKESINQIQLDFENKNFDWKVVLEGSHNLKEWFAILNDYRILSVENDRTNYRYTNLEFPDAQFQFYRVLIKSSEEPLFVKAKIKIDTLIKGDYQEHAIANLTSKEINKQTILTIDLKNRVPIHNFKINIADKIDYYRPVTFEYLADSIPTEKGWRYLYRNLSAGTLSSFEKNEFSFAPKIAKNFRITIRNHDNQPLKIAGIEAKSYDQELIARFTKPANYFLVFGKREERKPKYDITHRDVKIPVTLTSLNLGEIEPISIKETSKVTPLFENKIWLWLTMAVVIIVLGGFTLKMIQKK